MEAAVAKQPTLVPAAPPDPKSAKACSLRGQFGALRLGLRNRSASSAMPSCSWNGSRADEGFIEPIIELLSHIENSDLDAWIASVQAVRAALESEGW